MAITTYATLKTAIGNWLDRDDLTTYVDDFIDVCEANLRDDLRIRQLITTADVTINAEFVSLPTNFNEVVSFHISGSPIYPLGYLTPDQLILHADSVSSRPLFYTIVGAQFKFSATPNTAYTGKLAYHKVATALSDSNTSNEILAAYPNMYLFGALAAAEPFIGNDARLATWKAMYNEAVAKANSKSMAAEFAGPLQMVRA